jgi:hypothetical protein
MLSNCNVMLFQVSGTIFLFSHLLIREGRIFIDRNGEKDKSNTKIPKENIKSTK